MPLVITPATRAAAGTLTGLRSLASAYESATRQLDGILDGILGLADADLAEGKSVIWQSDGTGAGDDGDIMIKITAGGVTKTGTIIDFSTL